jgi:peptidoglycan L-alanyl-D-glutamate endopeptidase CwlK
MPLVYPAVNAQLPAAGLGFETYYASDSRGRPDIPPGYHRYGLREVCRAIEGIAAEWYRRHAQGPRLGIGDLSLVGGGPTPRHGAHQRGLEVDIRPLRSDGRLLPVTFNDPNYSRSLTQELVDVITRNPILPVRVILFNDPGVSGVRAYPGHDNHLHVGFLPPAAPAGPAAGAITNQTATPNVTVAMVSQMFTGTPVANIQTNLPFVLRALTDAGLGDKAMILMALATIRAETGNFTPLSEFQSRFNTPPGGPPFSLYDNRHDLGNQGPPDGANFRGRGYIQLTGRSNYQLHGAAIGLGNQLITNPALANQPDIAAKLLASFLKRKELAIRNALSTNNLALARRLVNGGSHGLQAFTAAYNIGRNVIP